MIYFLDASALVKRYVKEPGSEEVRRLFRGKNRIATSRVSAVEVPAALARRSREGDLPRSVATRHARRVSEDLAETYVVAPNREVLEIAAELVWRHPLRAYDAVQLASALRLAREVGAAMGDYDSAISELEAALAAAPESGKLAAALASARRAKAAEQSLLAGGE